MSDSPSSPTSTPPGTARPDPPDWLSLEGDERVWMRASPSGNLVLGSLTVGFVVLLTMSIVVSFFTDLETGRVVSFVVLLSILAMLGATYLVINRREYVLTNRRAYAAVGLSTKEVTSVDLENIRDVTLDRSGWRGWLNVGDLQFLTTEGVGLRFAFIENPQGAYERVLESIEASDSGV